MSSVTYLIFSLLLLFHNHHHQVTSYRILIVYPAPSYSHQQVQQAVSQGLAEAGHELVIITPNPSNELKNHENVTQIDASFLYETFKMSNFVKATTPREFMVTLQEIYPKTINDLMSMREVQALIKSKNRMKFDAVICENLGFSSPFFMFAEIDDAVLIGLSTLEMPTNYYAALGNIRHPILHSGNFAAVVSAPNFWERLKAVYENLVIYYWEEHEYSPAFDWIIRKHFNSTKTSNELIKRMNFAIDGVSSITGYARPLLPNVVQIGFLHVKPVKPLPDDFEKFILESKHGVIYCSFGTNVKSNLVDFNLVEIMMRTFTGLKYDVLWKFDGEIKNSNKNIKIVNWAPQQDILGHKNVKLFITQGGAQSRDESIARGVPLLVIPFFADQFDTANKIQDIGIGKMLTRNEMTVNSLKNAILSILENETYTERSQEIARIVADSPMTPVQTAIYWIEYAIRNKNSPQFKYKGRNMPFYQYFLLDVITFVLSCVALISLCMYWIVKKLQEPKFHVIKIIKVEGKVKVK